MPSYRDNDDRLALVMQFIDRINAGAIDALAALMSDDHTLTVFSEPPLAGRDANIAAWHGYASSFPAYRIYPHKTAVVNGEVSVLGHTTGSHLGLPDDEESQLTLIWRARTNGGKIGSWTLIEDNPDNRRRYGLGDQETCNE